MENAMLIAAILAITLSTLFLFFSTRTTEEVSTESFDEILKGGGFEDEVKKPESTAESAAPQKSTIENASAESKEEQKENDGLKNVFDVKQTPPTVEAPSATHDTNEQQEEKPFKSSYYYAHNNSKVGYKDGLKAEDYVMNGPKLLSKGNSTASTPSPTSTAPTQLPQASGAVATSSQAATLAKLNSTPVSRYMWDDDGSADGIARILIDSLPSNNDTVILWKDVAISKEDVVFKLLGEWKNGLNLQIRGKIENSEDKGDDAKGIVDGYNRYHLYIPRMHGEVEDVKLIVKAKKLIVKLYKKKQPENLKVWPQLPSKMTKAAPSSTIDSVGEDLFV